MRCQYDDKWQRIRNHFSESSMYWTYSEFRSSCDVISVYNYKFENINILFYLFFFIFWLFKILLNIFWKNGPCSLENTLEWWIADVKPATASKFACICFAAHHDYPLLASWRGVSVCFFFRQFIKILSERTSKCQYKPENVREYCNHNSSFFHFSFWVGVCALIEHQNETKINFYEAVIWRGEGRYINFICTWNSLQQLNFVSSNEAIKKF